MNYPVNTTACDGTGACSENKIPTQPMADIMKETSILADDALNMVSRINDFLFGNRSDSCEKEAEPRCFHEELVKTRYKISAACEELAKLSSMLGM